MARGHEDDPAQGGKGLPAAFEGLGTGLKGLGHRPSSSAFGWQDAADAGGTGAEHTLPGLHEDERLPWLYSAEDAQEDAGVDPGRVWAVVLAGLALLLLMGGSLWWSMHRRDGNADLADGSLIAALAGPIKVPPRDPGGKLFDGTGDSSFAVSQGQIPGATLANADAAQQDGGIADVVVAKAGAAGGAVGVQLGAFSTQDAAESAWGRLAKAYDALSGTSHRIVAGTADIGTVYHLQAVAGSDAAANALCDRLKVAGLNCEVKD